MKDNFLLANLFINRLEDGRRKTTPQRASEEVHNSEFESGSVG